MGISIRGINKGLSTGLKDSGMLKFFGDMGMPSSEINASLRRANSLIGKDVKDKHAAGAKLAGELQSFVNGDMTHYDRFKGIFQGTRMEGRINSFAPSPGQQFLDRIGNSYTGEIDDNLQRRILRHANKLDGKRNVGENYVSRAQRAAQEKNSIIQESAANKNDAGLASTIERIKTNREVSNRLGGYEKSTTEKANEAYAKQHGQDPQQVSEQRARSREAERNAPLTTADIDSREFVKHQNKVAQEEQAAREEAKRKNALPKEAQEYNKERQQRRLGELRGKFRNMQGQMDTSVSNEQAARASQKSMERHGVDPSSVKVESSAQQSATAKNDKPPASAENPTASPAPQSGGAETHTQSGGGSTGETSGGDSLQAKMLARMGKASGNDQKHMFERLAGRAGEFDADMKNVKNGDFKGVAEQYGLNATDEAGLRKQFGEKLESEVGQGPTTMDWVMGNHVPHKVVGGAAIAGAMSSIFGGGQRSNADLYSNPFQ